jgi:hypothetical protein
MLRDLAQSADQSKQDEVFIGGLPSHWKAQQVKELLAPYGQLKSLSVAMDAATGKNKVRLRLLGCLVPALQWLG